MGAKLPHFGWGRLGKGGRADGGRGSFGLALIHTRGGQVAATATSADVKCGGWEGSDVTRGWREE